MKQVEFEVTLQVEDYIPFAPDDLDAPSVIKSAFDAAACDTEEACKEAMLAIGFALIAHPGWKDNPRGQSAEALLHTLNEMQLLYVEFLEFDSGNWTHAGAHWLVKADVPDEWLPALVAAELIEATH
jgi:hypothetical protein